MCQLKKQSKHDALRVLIRIQQQEINKVVVRKIQSQLTEGAVSM